MALETKKIEYLTDENRYEGMALVKIETWEEFCKIANDGSNTIALYQGTTWDGEFVSFDYTDEKNPSQYDLEEATRDWLNDEYNEGNAEVKEWAEEFTDEDGDIDWTEFASCYVGEYWTHMEENGEKPFMSSTEDGGPFGGKNGVWANSWNNDFTAYKVVDLEDYLNRF